LIRGLQKDGQKIKALIFADELPFSGVKWKKLTFLAGYKALTVRDFGEYFYNLGTTPETPGMESCAKNRRRKTSTETRNGNR